MQYGCGKQYQIIAFAIKGKKPRVFNRLRIDYPIAHNHKYERENGIYVTDVWDDIKELTSGYFAGDEGLRDKNDKRVHEQQSPVALLLRIILSSTNPGDTFFDGMAGIGTSAVVASQLNRNSINIELSSKFIKKMKWRLKSKRESDNIMQYRDYYRFTENLDEIWPINNGD